MKERLIIAGIVVTLFLILVFAYLAESDCEKSGGVMVRGVFKVNCVKLEAKP